LLFVAICVVHAQNTTIIDDDGFTTNVTGWSVEDGKRFVHYSYAAYCPTAALKTWKCAFCQGKVTLIDTVSDSKTNTFGFVAYDADHNQVVVSYRGTKPTSIKNWIDDLKFWKADSPFDGLAGAYVAKGFYDCSRALAPATMRAVRSALQAHPGAKVAFTGHSLGGAIATLASLDLQVSGIPSETVYTFGSPRVGNKAFFSTVQLSNGIEYMACSE